MTVSMSLAPTDDEQAIRESVRAVCAKFDDGYARRKHEEGKPPTELWEALAAGLRDHRTRRRLELARAAHRAAS